MSTFGREFPIKGLPDIVLKEKYGWLRDLLYLWHPAGDAIGRTEYPQDSDYLRLSVRNGYLNFYRAGQSVAKVGVDRHGKLHAKIHNKYVYGKHGSGQSYVTISDAYPENPGSTRLVRYDGPARLREWISEANKHSSKSKEKRFIDLVVARNPNVIDLEMGLPAYSEIRHAPRMDLVAIEPMAERWRVVFWEAKLVSNPEARCRGEEKEPRVIRKQLKDYCDWIGHKNHGDLVAQAYQHTCHLLVDLHAVARRLRPDIEELGAGIRQVAAPDASPLLIDDKPRLLVDARKENAFTKNGHLEKLHRMGLHVQMVQNDDRMTLETHA